MIRSPPIRQVVISMGNGKHMDPWLVTFVQSRGSQPTGGEGKLRRPQSAPAAGVVVELPFQVRKLVLKCESWPRQTERRFVRRNGDFLCVGWATTITYTCLDV